MAYKYTVQIYDRVYTGNVSEVCSQIGINKSYFHHLVQGDYKRPAYMTIERVYEDPVTGRTEFWRRELLREWDSVRKPFADVKWVKTGGRKLRLGGKVR